jgi:hypothetical protein
MKYLLIGSPEEAISPFQGSDACYAATSRIRSSCPIVSTHPQPGSRNTRHPRGRPSHPNRDYPQ